MYVYDGLGWFGGWPKMYQLAGPAEQLEYVNDTQVCISTAGHAGDAVAVLYKYLEVGWG